MTGSAFVLTHFGNPVQAGTMTKMILAAEELQKAACRVGSMWWTTTEAKHSKLIYATGGEHGEHRWGGYEVHNVGTYKGD